MEPEGKYLLVDVQGGEIEVGFVECRRVVVDKI